MTKLASLIVVAAAVQPGSFAIARTPQRRSVAGLAAGEAGALDREGGWVAGTSVTAGNSRTRQGSPLQGRVATCPAAPAGYILHRNSCVGGPAPSCSGELATGGGCATTASCVVAVMAISH